MSDRTDNLQNLLKTLGLDSDQVSIYMGLLEKSPQSALELSKTLNMGRTKVYRILETLNQKGLVSILLDEYGSKFEANSPKQIELLIKEKETELEKVKTQSEKLLKELGDVKSSTWGETKILYYKGTEGLKQVTWNTLKAKELFRIYEINLMHAFIEPEFSEKVRMEFALRDIKVHQLTNHNYFEPFTKIEKHVKDWTLKYIDPKILSINTEACIYNDVYAMYSYQDKDIFCVEIYNQKFADMQKQIFDLIFSQAQQMTILNLQGEAKL